MRITSFFIAQVQLVAFLFPGTEPNPGEVIKIMKSSINFYKLMKKTVLTGTLFINSGHNAFQIL